MTSNTSFNSNWRYKVITLAVTLSMLPVIIIGTTTYYIGNKSLDSQLTQLEQTDSNDLAKAELLEQKRLLKIMLVGTEILALLSGGAAIYFANRFVKTATKDRTLEALFNPQRTIHPIEDLLDRENEELKESFYEQDLLNITVNEVKKALGSDRVIIYYLDDLREKTVIAEAIQGRWKKVLGSKIDEPGFEEEDLAEYQAGCIKAENDINQADVSGRYATFLSFFAVKASITVPIFKEDRLYGLLIAHQCSESRIWQQWEINYLARIATQVGLALEQAKYVRGQSELEEQLDWFKKTLVSMSLALKQIELGKVSISVPQTRSNDQLSLKSRPLEKPFSSLHSPATVSSEVKEHTVLVVDDSQTIREILTVALEKAGYRVIQAKDGKHALTQLQQHSELEIIVSDVEMPNMDGFEFLLWRNRNPQFAKLPVVMLSTCDSEPYRNLAKQLGAAAFFAKPYNESEFLVKLNSIVDSYYYSS